MTGCIQARPWRGGLAGGAAVLALALPLAACGSGGDRPGDESVRPSRSASPTPSSTPTVTAAEYDTKLAATLAPLDKALRAVDAASGDSALDTALERAAGAATRAGQALAATEAPGNALGAHTTFVGALESLAQGLHDAESGGERCAVAPRVDLGSGGTVGRAADAGDALRRLGYKVPLTLPRTEKAQHRRLANGHLVKDSARTGLGRLTVDNDTGSDAVVTLTKGGGTVFSVYVRKHDRTTVRGIRNGSYTVYFTTGTDWSAAKKSFTGDCDFEKFDDRADFRTKAVSGGTQYDILTFSLAKRLDGNATSSEVPPGSFPS